MMTQTGKYRGTTVTAFIEQHFALMSALAFFLALLLFVAGRAPARWPALVIELFAFSVTFLLWLALIYQTLRARPWTALMELLACALMSGFIAVLAAQVVAWWPRRYLLLPLIFYMSLFLLLDEYGLTRRPPFTGSRARQLVLRLLCLLLAALLAYLLKSS